MHQGGQGHMGAVTRIPIGGFFNAQHQETARAFYSEPGRQGYCALGCAATAQRKPWRRGYPLAASVVRYPLPRPLEVQLGTPPDGHHYVRVGADILLLTRDTSEVVDAIENGVR